ncbi:succinylglutamate desuccinylase/aspartoacylase family protein [Ornithinimicrobium sp. F0845]|uniref:M14 family zinc carboxypeptidase n=1 Tax=Ornithinimicrobium sp. F0845 TaxID=2926412 RepID=UPI001FF0E97C|nr:M14 family zinc carboxypeptidase [Ornithinimicrobium sp. F0845]MCK0113843.1 succinylglutamate desuccinylase/aspartoacylase family protein [Ornithinimicrobium sp. F0845]
MLRSAPARLACVTAAAALAVAGAGVPGAMSAPDVAAVEVSLAPTEAPQGYPRQNILAEPPVDSSDAAIRLGLTPYHDIAPQLNALQRSSQRVSAEAIGQTVTGREVYLVTLTAPETRGETRQQERMRERILTQPQQAAKDRGLARKYKTPIFINANIHGNEWEGTDAALRLIEDYATSDDPEVVETLERSRIYLVITMNPDGRHDNTRANASGFDMNRDFITATQPEVVAVRDALIRTQPLVMLDLHGYVNGTLIEPTTPPHGENYEYDLFIKHAYPNGLGMEQAVLELGYTPEDDGVNPPQIPFRDWDEGWDDWPPIFTPQYAAYHGAVAHTVEIPLRVNNASYNLPEEELHRRSAINTNIAHAAITSSIGYVQANRAELLADQIEIFRRGVTGAEPVEVTDELFPEIGPEDVYLTEYPRAYIIPVGDEQRSAPAAARLVDHLIANGVEVRTTRVPVTVDGQTYPAGSYVVDMHQARRGLANTILGPGTDISDRVDSMYDISGWSLGLLWGADVATIPQDGSMPRAGRPIASAEPTGQVTGDGDLLLHLNDPADLAALNHLARSDAGAEWLADGSVLVPEESADRARATADAFGVTFSAAPVGASGEPVDELVVAAAATPEERWALNEMGFEVREINATVLNDGFNYSDVDALYVSTAAVSWSSLEDEARNDMASFLRDGGGLVGRGLHGVRLNGELQLLDVTLELGNGDGNGVVAVDSADTAIGSGATPHSFVYSPAWFTGLGEDITVDQRYASEDVLVSGHWAGTAEEGGQDAAAGAPVIVSGTNDHGSAVLFGSQPLFRAHPKGQYSLVGRALFWSTLQD